MYLLFCLKPQIYTCLRKSPVFLTNTCQVCYLMLFSIHRVSRPVMHVIQVINDWQASSVYFQENSFRRLTRHILAPTTPRMQTCGMDKARLGVNNNVQCMVFSILYPVSGTNSP